jgi:hypothetical protein
MEPLTARPQKTSNSTTSPATSTPRSPSIESSSSSTSVASTKSRSLPTISSRISVRHGISEEDLTLLSANPPETKLTELSYNTAQAKDGTIIDTETGIEVLRHSDLWFEDGSVICRAENTLFCVHMSQLARHSLVFHDMVMLSHPETSRIESSMILHEGRAASRRVPVVYLYDSAEDVGNLLTALYDGPYVPFKIMLFCISGP